MVGRDDADPAPTIEEFLDDPTREPAAWERLWRDDLQFPIRSHRGFLGRLIVAAKRLLRPLVKSPQNDLWQRQRVFNLVLLELRQRHDRRIAYLESAVEAGLNEVMDHNDALFSRVDQKLDRYRAEAEELYARLGAALERAEAEEGTATLRRSVEEGDYLDFESRFRGTEEEIEQRQEVYLPYLEGSGPLLDLGCGRGEALDVFAAAGLEVEGIDASAEMVARCRERGHRVEEGDVFEHLAARRPEGLGAVTAFHLLEHLPSTQIPRLLRLAYGALRPGGRFVAETPSPLSLVVASNFWLDPTHRRPVHPDFLEQALRQAGFDPVERLDLHPFPSERRLPEIALGEAAGELARIVDRINRLRDELDELLYGTQDYAVIATRPA